MSSPLLRNIARAKSIWGTRRCTSLVGPSTMSCLPVQIGTACRHTLHNISSDPSLSESRRDQDDRGSPTISITLELKGARQFLEALAPRSLSPASTGVKVPVDATAPTQGSAMPHAANGLRTHTDVEALKAAVEECTQQAQNLLVFAKKAGWAAEDLGNTPVHLIKKQAASARDGTSLQHNKADTSALQVAASQPVADTKDTKDAQPQVPLAEHMHLATSYASLHLEHSSTLARLHFLESAFESAEAQRTAAVAELEELRSQVRGMELLQSDHQELKDEHTALTHNHEQLTKQYEQQWQKTLALQGQHQLQLSEAQQVRAQSLAELQDLKQKYGTDLDRLQIEVLSLEDQLDIYLTDLKVKTGQEKHLQQQFGHCQQQYVKAKHQLSACNSKFEAERQEQQAAREQLVTENVELQQKLGRSEDNALTLQQERINCSSILTRALDSLKASHLRCSELEQDLVQSRASSSDAQSQLATLQADLKQLHDLTAGGHLNAEDLFHMFAKPVSSQDSGHSLEEPGPPPATAASDRTDTDQTPCKGNHLFTDVPKESADSQTAGASGDMPFPKDTSVALVPDFDATANIAATSSRRHVQCDTGHDKAGAEAKGRWPAGAEQEHSFEALDDDEVVVSAEDVSKDERAAELQRDLAREYKCRYLSHTAALYVGAQAYASSAPQHSFSTQEVILSMLQHDSTFLQLLAMKSHEAGIDQFILESAVAGIYRALVEQEESAWRFKRRRPAFICSSATQASCLSGAAQQERMPNITMVIPSNLKKVDQVALHSLYQYWGVPCAPDMYRS